MSNLYYLVSDYFATGEGRCISMMITCVEYNDDDYQTKPKWYTDENGQWVYDEGILKEGMSEVVSLTKKFVKEYGDWYGRGLEILTRNEYLERYNSCIPEFVKNITDPNKGTIPWFEWKQQIYFNFS